MARSNTPFIPLLPHPQTPSAAVSRAAARAGWAGPHALRLQYVLEADPERIRIPSPAAGSGRADELWAHTCCEAFVGLDASPQYLELNFSPSGDWAAYRFELYRQGMMPAALDPLPRLTLRRGEKRLELQAEVCLGGALPAAEPGAKTSTARLRIALSMVVEDRQGRLSYWALRHPPGRPDFHHPEGFSLALEFPRQRP